MRRFVDRLGVRLATSGLQALCIVLIARQVGPSAFGQFALGISLGVIVGTLLGFGATTRALRILREPEPVVMASSLSVYRLGSAAITACAVAGVLVVLGADSIVAAAIGIVAAVDHFCDYEQTVRAGFLEHRGSAVVILLQRGLPAAAVTTSFLAGWNCIVAYAAAALLVICLVLVRPVARFDGRLDLQAVRIGALGYWWGTVASATQQFDMVLAKASTGLVGTGLYGAANRLVSPLGLVVNSAVVAFSPSYGQIEDFEQRHRVFRRFALVASLFGAVLVLLSPFIAWIVGLVLGAAYVDARPIIIGVTAASGIGAAAQVLQSYMYMEGKAVENARYALSAVVAGLAAMFISGLLLGPSWLWTGLFVNYTTLTVLLVFAFRRHSKEMRGPAERNRDSSKQL